MWAQNNVHDEIWSICQRDERQLVFMHGSMMKIRFSSCTFVVLTLLMVKIFKKKEQTLRKTVSKHLEKSRYSITQTKEELL